MKTLPIVWQRLVDAEGATCPRCHDTGQAVQDAFERLKLVLAPLGIEPTLECREIDAEIIKESTILTEMIPIIGIIHRAFVIAQQQY